MFCFIKQIIFFSQNKVFLGLKAFFIIFRNFNSCSKRLCEGTGPHLRKDDCCDHTLAIYTTRYLSMLVANQTRIHTVLFSYCNFYIVSLYESHHDVPKQRKIQKNLLLQYFDNIYSQKLGNMKLERGGSGWTLDKCGSRYRYSSSYKKIIKPVNQGPRWNWLMKKMTNLLL